MGVLDKAVTSEKDGYLFQCPGVQGSPCGDPGGRPFHSTRWPTKKAALERGRQHLAEHKGEGHMQPMHEFLADQGLVHNEDGSVSVGDL